MKLKQLSISRFRNIIEAEVEFPTRINVLVGRNGQGKTSVLEAMYLLGHNRSFRTAKSEEIKSRLAGTGDTAVSGIIDTEDGEKTLAYRYQDGRKQVFINGSKISSAAQFVGAVKIIDFTPDDLFLVKGTPQERRRFLDKLLALQDREYLEALVRYQRALKNRNALLTSGFNRPRNELRVELSHWEKTLIEDGLRIGKRREALSKKLSSLAQVIYSEFVTDGAAEKIESRYESKFLKVKELEEGFSSSLERDLKLRTTTFGVHRDDLLLTIDTGFGSHSAKQIASQGQTRSAALALKLAGVEYLRDSNPIVLLDDVESELDKGRRERLLEYLLSLKSQIFIATTDRAALPGLAGEAVFFGVEGGKIFSQ